MWTDMNLIAFTRIIRRHYRKNVCVIEAHVAHPTHSHGHFFLSPLSFSCIVTHAPNTRNIGIYLYLYVHIISPTIVDLNFEYGHHSLVLNWEVPFKTDHIY